MDQDKRDLAAHGDDPTSTVHAIDHKQLNDLSSEALAKMVCTGQLELVIDSALSEWGSVVEDLFHKLERGVNDWHDPSSNRTVTVRFIEIPAAAVMAADATEGAPRSDDVGS